MCFSGCAAMIGLVVDTAEGTCEGECPVDNVHLKRYGQEKLSAMLVPGRFFRCGGWRLVVVGCVWLLVVAG